MEMYLEEGSVQRANDAGKCDHGMWMHGISAALAGHASRANAAMERLFPLQKQMSQIRGPVAL